MNRLAIGILVGTAAALAATVGGCGSSTVEFGTGGAGHGGAGGTTSSGGTAGSTATGDTTTSSGSPTTSSSSSSSGSATTSSSSSSSSSTGGGGCTVDPQDDACVKCSKQSCCAELVPCQNDQSCVCWTGCLAQNPNNPNACFGCGMYDNVTQSFVNCAAQKCGTQCGGGGTTSSSSSSSSSSGSPVCAPASGDTACTTCAKMNCCNDVAACTFNQNCACIVGCLQQGYSYTQCTLPMACGPAGTTFLSLAACTSGSCQGKCQ